MANLITFFVFYELCYVLDFLYSFVIFSCRLELKIIIYADISIKRQICNVNQSGKVTDNKYS